MSRLDIIAADDIKRIDEIKAEYHAWNKTGKWRNHPADHFPYVDLPAGREKETLRAILAEARVKDKLSFRFWWAGRDMDGKIALFISFTDVAATDRFADICEKYEALNRREPI
jgi:hypothetical protein